MAKQRQTDVNINYKVNVAELERSEQLAKKAQATTDQLRQSVTTFGNSAGKSFQTTSKYIEGMEVELARLRQQIKLTSTQDTARLTQLSTQYKALKQQVDAYNKSLFETASASKQTAQASQNMASQFGQVITAVKTFIAVGFAREVVNVSLEMAKLAGNVEGVKRAFDKQIPGADSLLIRLRESTQGAVGDLELMQKALQARNFGIDVQRLPELLEFAAIRAQQTGVSVDYLVNSIVTGIGRKSLLILDNLGISATRLKQEFNGAALASQTVGEVTNGVANIAQEEMKKMGGFVHTAATEVDQLTVSWQELRTEMAKTLNRGPAGGMTGFLQGYVDSFKALFKAINEGKDVSQVFLEQQRQTIAQMSVNEFNTRVLTGTKEENIKAIEDEVAALTKSIGSWTAFRDEMEKQNKADQDELELKKMSYSANKDEIIQLAQGITFRRKMIDAKKEDALIDQDILKLLQSRLQALKEIRKEEDPPPVKDLGPRQAPGKFSETINIDLINPVTGEVGKFDRDNVVKAFNDMINLSGQLWMNVYNARQQDFKIQVSPEIIPMDEWDKIAQEFANHWKEIVSAGIQDTANIINSFVDDKAERLQNDLDNLQRYYDKQIEMAGDNELQKQQLMLKRDKEEQKLRKRAWEAEKEAKRTTTIINGAAGVVNAFATLPYPAALVASVLIAAQTAAQLAVISKQNYKGFAKGVIDLQGPGSKTSDSIPARLSKGESVMTADETSSSKGILKAVRAKRLNDKVLKQLVSGNSGGSVVNNIDLAPVVKGLKDLKDSQPDLVLRGNLIYEGRKKGDNYKQYIRSKSMSK